MAHNNNSVRVILGTGGTIAGKASRPGDNVGYVAGQVRVEDLMAGVPALEGLPLEVEQVAQLDSKDMHLEVWKRLLERLAHHLAREDVSGVVVTHGTDTLEETAWLVESVLRPVKPVVFTCAMRPATALVPDGPQNLLDAVTVAGLADVHGTVVVCAGQVHAARDVAKVHSYRVDAFDSGDAGPLACVEEGQLRWYHPQPAVHAEERHSEDLLQQVLAAPALPVVHVVTSHADTDGGLVKALLLAAEKQPALLPRGLVVAATGNGTVHQALGQALEEARAQGVRVVRATRCARGRVIPDPANPLVDSAGLSPVKARISLALALLAEDGANP